MKNWPSDRMGEICDQCSKCGAMKHSPSDRIGNNDIPGWICDECAVDNGMRPTIKKGVVYHVGECAWCGRDVPVSNSEDWTKKLKGRTK